LRELIARQAVAKRRGGRAVPDAEGRARHAGPWQSFTNFRPGSPGFSHGDERPLPNVEVNERLLITGPLPVRLRLLELASAGWMPGWREQALCKKPADIRATCPKTLLRFEGAPVIVGCSRTGLKGWIRVRRPVGSERREWTRGAGWTTSRNRVQVQAP